MEIGYNRDLYLLAFDHRGSFQSQLLGIVGTPSAEETARIAEAKTVIYEGFLVGFLKARARGMPQESLGVLVDEEFGSCVARRATRLGVVLAMPVEASGCTEFDFEYGADFGAHIEAFDPAFAKVLVRYNPDDDADMNARQTVRLRQLADWLHKHKRKFLFELLVPATQEQLATAGNDTDRYDRKIRPELVVRTIAALQDAGVEADVWKIEGLDTPADCQRVVQQARHGGRDNVACIVLGRGANPSRVAQWLHAGSRVPGYQGFAIGRTLWWDALVGFRDGLLNHPAAAKRIAENYLRAIEVYRNGAAV